MVYNSSWSRVIKAADLGLKIGNVTLEGFVCADDSVSCNTLMAELLTIRDIYEFFSEEYDMLFQFAKTIVNVFGNERTKKILQEEDFFRLGGEKPQFEETSVHLGILMSEDLEKVDEINVDNRLKKTTAKIFLSQSPSIGINKRLPLQYLTKIH